MSFNLAKSCFRENIQLTGGADRDLVSFNLYNGLFQLAQQLEKDLESLKGQVRQLEYEIQSRR